MTIPQLISIKRRPAGNRYHYRLTPPPLWEALGAVGAGGGGGVDGGGGGSEGLCCSGYCCLYAGS